jgi:hypothetical protein
MILVSQAPNPLPDDGDDIIASTRHALANGFELVNLPTALMHVHEVAPALADVAPYSTTTGDLDRNDPRGADLPRRLRPSSVDATSNY